MKIIKLTQYGGQAIYVNVDYIRYFVPSNDEKFGTRMDINDGGDSYTNIIETPEEVVDLIR